MLDWFLSQWTAESINAGTWYNIPAILVAGFSAFAGLCCAAFSIVERDSRHDSRMLARWALILLFGLPTLAVFWPLVFPLLVVGVFGWVVWRAW